MFEEYGMSDVAIVVPVYKPMLSSFECIALRQLMRVLKRYPKYFIMPQSLTVDEIKTQLNATCEILKFNDAFFQDIYAYTELMVANDFYSEFLQYRYILVYQLDAFVFCDRLNEFCELKYDYIGAPWFRWTPMYRFSGNLVGNGGLSLRHVKHTLQVLVDHPRVVHDFLLNVKISGVGEDGLFAYFGAHTEYSYRSAPVQIAKKFSLEVDFQKSYGSFPSNLPFGCHHWYKMDYHIWKPYIESFGYRLPSQEQFFSHDTTKSVRLERIVNYRQSRILDRSTTERKLIGSLAMGALNTNGISVWGLGKIGRRCIDFLQGLFIPIKGLYDTQMTRYMEKQVCSPEKIFADHTLLILASAKYKYEMENYARKVGHIKFIRHDEFEWIILKCYQQFLMMR